MATAPSRMEAPVEGERDVEKIRSQLGRVCKGWRAKRRRAEGGSGGEQDVDEVRERWRWFQLI